MKKLFIALTTIIFLCLNSTNSFSAIDADTVWEVRADGNDNNGGGYNSTNATPGTDFSQQSAAEDSGTDLACADGDAAAPVVTSATHNFVDADEGNLIHIYETGDGFTVGWYEIVSTNANAATLDRACGTDGAKTGGDWSLGGALIGIETAYDVAVDGNTIYVKAGTYTLANTVDVDNACTETTDIWIIGYNTDRAADPTGTNRPLVNGNGAAVNCFNITAPSNHIKNFRLTGATADGLTGDIDYDVFIVENVTSYSNGDDGFGGTDALYIKCEAYTNTDNGWEFTGYGLIGCYSHDNTGEGIQILATLNSYVGCISDSNSADGFAINNNQGGVQVVSNCVAYNNTGAGSDGFYDYFALSVSGLTTYFTNCLSVGNGQYAFNDNSTSSGSCYLDYSGWNGHGTELNNILIQGNNNIGDVDPSFTNAAAGDFTLQSGSGAIGTGLSQAIPGATGDYQWNIGADQDDNTAAGGGGGGASFFSMN